MIPAPIIFDTRSFVVFKEPAPDGSGAGFDESDDSAAIVIVNKARPTEIKVAEYPPPDRHLQLFIDTAPHRRGDYRTRYRCDLFFGPAYVPATAIAADRSGCRCETCGLVFLYSLKADLRAHLHYESTGPESWKLSRLLCVCRACHRIIHSNTWPAVGTYEVLDRLMLINRWCAEDTNEYINESRRKYSALVQSRAQFRFDDKLVQFSYTSYTPAPPKAGGAKLGGMGVPEEPPTARSEQHMSSVGVLGDMPCHAPSSSCAAPSAWRVPSVGVSSGGYAPSSAARAPVPFTITGNPFTVPQT